MTNSYVTALIARLWKAQRRRLTTALDGRCLSEEDQKDFKDQVYHLDEALASFQIVREAD